MDTFCVANPAAPSGPRVSEEKDSWQPLPLLLPRPYHIHRPGARTLPETLLVGLTSVRAQALETRPRAVPLAKGADRPCRSLPLTLLPGQG